MAAAMRTPHKPWHPQELALLREIYPYLHTADVAALMQCTVSRVNNAAHSAGLRKSAEYLDSDTSMRIQRGKQNAAMIATRFKPGHRSWNTGMRGWAAPGTEATRFKPGILQGNAAKRWVPIGTLRLNGDGYLDRKITDLHRGPRDWEAVHRLVWVAAHGPVPEGHVITFLPDKKTTVLEQITPDVLECISRGELARRNHPRNKSPELARLVQLKGAITRQVNRITREAEQAREQRA